MTFQPHDDRSLLVLATSSWLATELASYQPPQKERNRERERERGLELRVLGVGFSD